MAEETDVVLRVLRGRPDEEELAALLVVLRALAGRVRADQDAGPSGGVRPGWTRPPDYSSPASWSRFPNGS